MSQLFVPLILIICSIGLFFTYLSPGYSTLQAFQDQAKRIEKAEQDIAGVIQKKEDLARQYVAFDQDDLDTLKLVVPTKVDVVQTIIILDTLAREYNLYVESFGVPSADAPTQRRPSSQEVEVREYGSASFSISLTGSYDSIKRFLYQIEQSAALLDVVEFMIEPGDTENTTGLLNFNITLSAYYLY